MSHLTLFMSGDDPEGERVVKLLEDNDLPFRVFDTLKLNGKEQRPELLDRRSRSFVGFDEIRDAVGDFLIPAEDGYYAKTSRAVRRERLLRENGDRPS